MPIVFILVAFAGILGGFMMEGGELGALVGPTALMIVLGGTIGATGVSVPFEAFKQAGKCISIALFRKSADPLHTMKHLQELSQVARKDGLLALEGELKKRGNDPFLTFALQLVIDGMHSDEVYEVLDNEIRNMSRRHLSRAKVFDAAGGYCPTFGIVGTVTGLVHILGSLDEPETLGPKIAVAFLATLYGIFFANILFIPIGTKLKALDAEEVLLKTMIADAMISLSMGESPAILSSKLGVFTDAAGKRRLARTSNG